MKLKLFFFLFIIIFSSSGYYVYTRTLQAFEGSFVESNVFLGVFVSLLLSFIIGKIIEASYIGIISNTLIRIGSFSLGVFFYALLLIIALDFIRLVNYIVPFYPNYVVLNYQITKLVAGLFILAVSLTVFMFGYINSRTPKLKKLSLKIIKKNLAFSSLNIVAVSDIHLGSMVNKSKAKRLVKMINSVNPDLVVFAGDIIDDNIALVKHDDLLSCFKKLKPKYGVYACLGNHEYMSQAYKDLNCFEENGIHILRDSAVKIDDKFYIIGRDDLAYKGVSGKDRKTLSQLSKDVDFSLPVILLDHQPYRLDETAEFDIDFQFSGHTHHGQVWPLNYITNLIFEQDWGYLKKKNTHFYISCGYGTSLSPIRVGNKPEIVNVEFAN